MVAVRPVEVFTSLAFRNGKAAIGIVIHTPDQTARVIRRAVRADSRLEAAYRALLHGVWRARALGARRLRAHADHAEVVEQLTGRAEVPPELTGLYLQTRALLNAFRWATVEFIPRERNAEAALTAVEALDQAPAPAGTDLDLPEPLPLWAATEEVTA